MLNVINLDARRSKTTTVFGTVEIEKIIDGQKIPTGEYALNFPKKINNNEKVIVSEANVREILDDLYAQPVIYPKDLSYAVKMGHYTEHKIGSDSVSFCFANNEGMLSYLNRGSVSVIHPEDVKKFKEIIALDNSEAINLATDIYVQMRESYDLGNVFPILQSVDLEAGTITMKFMDAKEKKDVQETSEQRPETVDSEKDTKTEAKNKAKKLPKTI